MSISVVVQQAECLLEIEQGMSPQISQYAEQIPSWLSDPDFATSFKQASIVGKDKTYSEAEAKATLESSFSL